jgi:hypothetical protein
LKPVIAVLWILSIALAVGLTRLAGPDRVDSESRPSFEKVFGEFDPLLRGYLIGRSLQDLGPDDLPELQRVLVDRNMGIQPEEVRLVMLAWARFDAPGAYAWAREGPKGWRGTLTDEAIYAWGYHDGPEAMRVAEEIEDLEFRERLKQNALQGWLRSEDTPGVTDYIANYPDMKRRGRLFFLLAGEIVMTRGEGAAMDWVESLPDDVPNQLKLGVFHHVAKMVTSKDPMRAAEWFLEHREEPYSEGALTGIALRWAQHHDRPAFFDWLLAMSSDGFRAGERDKAVAQGFRSWMQIDPDAAQAWLLPMLPNPALDPAIEEALKRLLPTDPDVSMEWARRLSDEDERRGQTIRVGIRWRRDDPQAFSDWLKESDLSEETRRKILRAPAPERRGAAGKGNPKPAAAGKP